MAESLSLKNVQKIGGELALAWGDGEESYLPLENLRRACPCAACAGEPDAMGNVQTPQISYTPASFDLTGWEMVGGYGWQPRWGDGHRTGIYSFRYLRQLGLES